MKLAFSSNGLQKVSLESAIETIHSFCFPGIEILLDSPHWIDTRKHSQYTKKIISKLRAHELEITNLNANDCHLLGQQSVSNLRPIDPDEAVRKTLRQWHSHCLELSVEFGGPPVSFATGPQPPNTTQSEALDHLKFHIDFLLKKVENLKTPLTIEFEPDHLIHSWSGAQKILDEFNHPLFGLNLDIGHVACSGGDILETAREALPKVYNIHFEDIRDRIHEHLVPGTGELPLLELLDYLEKSHYSKGLTVELYNHSHRAPQVLQETQDYFSQHRPHWLKDSLEITR